jgi:hypothetical protein
MRKVAKEFREEHNTVQLKDKTEDFANGGW